MDKLAKFVTSKSQESSSDVIFKTENEGPLHEEDSSGPTDGRESEEHGKGEERHVHGQYVTLGMHTETFFPRHVEALGTSAVKCCEEESFLCWLLVFCPHFGDCSCSPLASPACYCR